MNHWQYTIFPSSLQAEYAAKIYTKFIFFMRKNIKIVILLLQFSFFGLLFYYRKVRMNGKHHLYPNEILLATGGLKIAKNIECMFLYI